MDSVLEDSRRRRRDVRIVWLDLKNAFGSVPHYAMWDVMDALKVPSQFKNICREIYGKSTQRIRSAQGLTEDIPLTTGIKQGCPLSPLLFNLVLEGVLPHVEQMDGGYQFSDGASVNILAYADDICVIAKSKEEMERMLNKIHRFAKWANLKFNPNKSGCLSMINHGSRKYVDKYRPKLGEDVLPALKWNDRYKYLGVDRGRIAERSPTALAEAMLSDAESICKSALADWQKVDALNVFVLTKASYHLSAATVDRTWCQKLDARIRKFVKKGLKLPARTVTTFFYTSQSLGGLGLTRVEESMDVANINRALRCLSSPDDRVNTVAWNQLSTVTKRRLGREDIRDTDIQDFLNSPPAKGEYKQGDVRSLWSAVRKSLQRLECQITVTGTEIKISHEEEVAPARNRIAVKKILDQAKNKINKNELLEAKDQGRAFHLIGEHPSSSHWMREGDFTSFAEFRFAIKGRLNLLPTKTTVKRAGRPDLNTTCPKCHQQPETLGHVLNACTPNTGLMRERHNKILKRLSNAINEDTGDKYVEQTVRGAPGDLRPDLVVYHNDNRVTIVDVTIPFESDELAFSKARAEKKQKYGPLCQWMQDNGRSDVLVEAFIVGSLGSWDKANEPILKRLNIGSKYASLFRKLCVSDVIKGSLAIWKNKN